MNITVVGGGNVGTQIAAHCAEKGHEVTVYTSKPQSFSKQLTVINENGITIHQGTIKTSTSDEREAFENAELVFITMPAYCMNEIAKKIFPFVHSGMKIGIVPGTGGGECAFAACIAAGAVLFGIQRVPSVARLEEYGKTVRATGYRKTLHVSALPNSATEEIRGTVASIFDMECESLPNYLNLTLTPSNPILHTTRLRTIFEDYTQQKHYDSLPLFYEEWSDESSHLLFKCDAEVQKLCRAMEAFDLSQVRSLKEHYESDTPQALTRKIRSIAGFKGLTTPSVKDADGYMPDLNSRYFTADFSYGLVIIKQIADIYGVDVPNISSTLEWYGNISVSASAFSFAEYGIKSREDFERFYSL
jgi:hypothetical protein